MPEESGLRQVRHEVAVFEDGACGKDSENGVLLRMDAQPIALGMVICQRNFELYTSDGQLRLVAVRLGMPVPTRLDGRVPRQGEEPSGIFRCPFQVTGLNRDERVDGVFGEDPFVALQYAIDFIGDRLKLYSKELGLTNKHQRPDGTRDSWIWTYPPDRQL
jgi:hypothetical protein